MHYAFGLFLVREFPAVQFERYADDAVVHCATERQAQAVWAALAERMESVGLRLHPDKTRIVYGQDSKRRRSYEHTSFRFLGCTFSSRKARNADGRFYAGFLPAVSREALKEMGQQIRCWRLHPRIGLSLDELADWINPIVAGWMNYFGRFYRSALHQLLQRINTYVMRWARKKYRRLRSFKRFKAWWTGILDREPGLFKHWTWAREFEWIQ